MKNDLDIPLPRGCAKLAKRAMLVAETLKRVALLRVHVGFEDSADPRARRTAEIDRLRELVAVQVEQLRILGARLEALKPRVRPHYPPHERFAILMLMARSGWSIADTAQRFLVTSATIASWKRRFDDGGEDALVEPRVPVNRFSELVAQIVKRLHVVAPMVGKRKVAAMLARAGLRIAASTVQRLRKRKATPTPKPPARRERSSRRVVTAKHAHHLWHVDITKVPIVGLALPWWPFALPLVWPFAWHVAVVVDHYTRAFVAFAVFKREPTSLAIARLLERARVAAGTAPRHIVSDRGSQFVGGAYLAWCERTGTRPRFGAIGKHGSIAVVERFIRSLKYEYLLRLFVPFKTKDFIAQIAAYQRWFNEHRPHSTLGGRTPNDVIEERVPPKRFEPRPRYPIPRRERREVGRVDELDIDVSFIDGHKQLPVIELRA